MELRGMMDEDTIPIVDERLGAQSEVAARYQDASSPWLFRMTYAIHGLCMLLVVLVWMWFGHFGPGFSWEEKSAAVFSWHPLFMTLGMVVCFSEAAISYRAFLFVPRPTRKAIHATLQGFALIFVTIGLVAVFRFHNENNIPNMYSFHSWLGLITTILFFGQFLFGFISFLFPKLPDNTRAAFVPVHAKAGMLLLSPLVTATICMGVLEKLTFGKNCNNDQHESDSTCRTANVFGLGVVCVSILVTLVLISARPS